MPYKNKETAQKYWREKKRQQRMSNPKKTGEMSNPNVQPIEVDVKTAAKLLLICRSCDKEVRGLDGNVNLLTLIRYGIEGPTLLSIKGQLDG